MFRHIKKDLIGKTQVSRAAEQQRGKKETANIHAYIGNLLGAGSVERVSMNGDTLVIKCSNPVAAHRARMHTQAIQEKTKTKRVFFLS